MKIIKNSEDISEEEFENLMNPPMSPQQAKAHELRNAFINRMMVPMKSIIFDIYGKEITPTVERALKRLSDVIYLECTD